MALLKLEEALQVKGRKFDTVELPELQGELRVASLTGGRALEFHELQARIAKGETGLERKVMSVLLQGGVVTEDGAPFFNEKTASQFIDKVSFRTVETVAVKITQMMSAEKPKSEGEPANP
jgi:hypothetical protein